MVMNILEDIRRINNTKIRFHSIDAKIPDHIKEQDCFGI